MARNSDMQERGKLVVYACDSVPFTTFDELENGYMLIFELDNVEHAKFDKKEDVLLRKRC